MACNGCCGPNDLSHAAPAYKRALGIVVALNLGMGAIEIVGGFVGRSQSLKADSLDFLGDGLITSLALITLSRGPTWRARAALVQGWFLATLAISVLGASLYRVFVRTTPEAEMMGWLGALGLAANLTSALVLIPHRHGDSAARAVWLFSRNDALANLAVIAAAGFVAWTRTIWPDLIAALAIAGLFLSSAITIIRDARADLLARKPAPPSPDSAQQGCASAP